VLERAEAPLELGTGLQLGPNAVRVLARLGLGPALFDVALRPAALELRSAHSAHLIARMPLAGHAEKRYGAPYCVLARPALHRLLTEAALRAGALIRYSSEVEGAVLDGDGVAVRLAGAAPVPAAALVGADGLWSRVRAAGWPARRPRRAGMTAWRAVLPPDAAAATPGPGTVTAWLAPRLHAVTYPIDRAGTLNIVVVAASGVGGEGWNVRAEAQQMSDLARGLCQPLSGHLAAAVDWRTWPLFDARLPGVRFSGPITLIGDAAHPMLPFIAAGAAMALEDSLALAAALAATPADPATAFRRCERARRHRLARVVAAARRNGRIFHLSGPLARARDLALGTLSGEALLGRFDWLYGGGPAAPAAAAHSGAT